MTPHETVAALAAILTTLDEEPGGAAPSGHLYAALQSADAEAYTLDAYERLIGIATRAGWIRLAGFHLVEITASGRSKVAQINALLNSRDGG